MLYTIMGPLNARQFVCAIMLFVLGVHSFDASTIFALCTGADLGGGAHPAPPP